MKLVIVGAGEVGSHLSQILSEAGHDITLIETSEEKALKLDEEQNVRVLEGNGSSAEVLIRAAVNECDAFLALTSDDRTNIVSCSLAKYLGARQTILRFHDQTYTDTRYINYQLHFGVDYMVNPEALCAVEIAKKIRNPGRVAVENFARGQIEVQQVEVSPASALIGKSLREVKLDRRIRVGYIQHADESATVAAADTVIEEGDILTLFGTPEVLYETRGRFDPDAGRETVRVVLFGGGETAIALIRLLSNPRFRIRILERDRTICRRLAEKFPNVTVIHGDGTSLRVMEEEQIGHADYFIACTKDDENNIVTALQASKLGVKHAHLVINKSDYDDVLDGLKGALDLELVVSPRVATANEIVRFLDPAPYVELARLRRLGGRILEFKVPPTSSIVNQALKDIPWPPHTVVVALLHKYQAKVPGADDTVLPNDRLVVITDDESKARLVELLRA